MNRYLNTVDFEALVLKALLQQVQVGFEIILDGARFCRDAGDNPTCRILGPDFKMPEAIRLQLDPDFPFPGPELNLYLIGKLNKEIPRLRAGGLRTLRTRWTA